MNTILLTWNPKYFSPEEMLNGMEHIRQSGYWDEAWTCRLKKSVTVGSQVYLMRVGIRPKGIVGVGVVTSEPYMDEHWIPERAKRGEEVMYCGVRFSRVAIEPIIPLELLESTAGDNYNWLPRASGQRIPEDIADKLEELLHEVPND
jgi:hypothetical protein